MTPIQFGTDARGMVGLFHTAGAQRPSAPAVLLCPGFGQEAVRAHRMYRVLAERLSRQGLAVMRFDYFGTGDSMGDGDDADLDGWTQDVRTAHHELMVRSGAKTVVWIGMRLGATLACLAARNAPPGLSRLVLWDPVTDGKQYLSTLRERHVAAVEQACGLPLKPTPSTVAASDPGSYNDQAMGFALPQRLRAQLDGLRLASLWESLFLPCVVVEDPSSEDGREVVRLNGMWPGRATVVDLNHDTDWIAGTAENGTLLSTQALMQLTRYAGAEE